MRRWASQHTPEILRGLALRHALAHEGADALDDVAGALGLALNSDADWRPYKVEGYLFIALIYMAFCGAMSRYSRWVEAYLNTGMRRQ